jgi:DNA-binding transcriptional regulator YiaG
MTDAEFRVVREHLGLTEEWLATYLGVSSRTVHHWQEGKFAIPDGVHVAVDHLQALTGEFVEDCIERAIVQPSVLTYRTDAEYDAAHPEQSWPASWHRAAVGRIAHAVAWATIAYAEQAAAAVEAARPGLHTDPPGMPDDERMTDAEFRVVREYLGLTEEWLATLLGVSSRTVHHWQEGKFAIPDGVRLAVEHLQDQTGVFVGGGILRAIEQPSVLTYRTDAEYHAAHPEQSWPASWHRAAVGQIAEGVPSVTIAYAELPGA